MTEWSEPVTPVTPLFLQEIIDTQPCDAEPLPWYSEFSAKLAVAFSAIFFALCAVGVIG